MKHATSSYNTNILHKIESLEKEIMDLKFSVLKKLTPSKKNLISLRGILKGVKISEEDIEEAKKSLYTKIII